MSPELQTYTALLLVALAICYLVRALKPKAGKSCGVACDCEKKRTSPAKPR